jgi:GNAT superfamily N-acetyltransferase
LRRRLALREGEAPGGHDRPEHNLRAPAARVVAGDGREAAVGEAVREDDGVDAAMAVDVRRHPPAASVDDLLPVEALDRVRHALRTRSPRDGRDRAEPRVRPVTRPLLAPPYDARFALDDNFSPRSMRSKSASYPVRRWSSSMRLAPRTPVPATRSRPAIRDGRYGTTFIVGRPSPSTIPRVLARGASNGDLTRAAAANQTEWMARVAEAAGGIARRERGVTWTASSMGATLAFPELPRERLQGLLPQFLGTARRARAREASCWSLLPTEPAELGDELAAVGFRDGWQAHWMAVEIASRAGGAPSDDVAVGLAPATWKATSLPWDGEAIAAVRSTLAAEKPRRVWHLGAWRDGRPVGHAVVNVTTGRLGVAGIYDMGVALSERRRGIGRALTLAALQLAGSQGCAAATLNATPEGELLYRATGFRSVGVAQTWWLDLD